MAEVRFENLRKLLKSMKENEWIIDTFWFKYKSENYVVILKVYNEKERKPSDYAKVKLEFIRGNNVKDSIHAYADFWEIVEMSSLNFLISIEAMLIVTYLLIFRKFLQSLYLLRK